MTEERALKVDPSWQRTVRWGGFSLFVAGAIIVVFVVGVFVSGQTLPLPAKAALEEPLIPCTLFLLVALGELLLMPAALGLYFALSSIRKAHVLVATGLMLAAVPMFLAGRGLIVSASRISGRYLSTASETMNAAYLA